MAASLCRLGCHSVGADGPSSRGGAAGVPALAVQEYGAARCVAERAYGDGDGAGQGGRGRGLQGQRRVRSLGCILVSLVCHGAGRTVRPLGVERQEWLLWLCRRTALHFASNNGHTETALALAKAGADVHCKDNEGYGCSGLHPRVIGLPHCGDGRSVPSGVELQAWLIGCAG
jgi:hypothetical protein